MNGPCFVASAKARQLPMEHGFAKNQRLLAAAEYKTVFDSPTLRFSNKHLLLLAKPNELEQSRLGLVMSKKNVGCSVKRNRLKRLCREAFRLHSKDFATIDIVLLGKPGVSNLENPAIKQAFVGLLDKLRGASTYTRQPSTTPHT